MLAAEERLGDDALMTSTNARLGNCRVNGRQLAHCVFQRLLYAADSISHRLRALNPSRKHVIGLVVFEFFREDLNGFGGYGKLVQNVSDYCNKGSRRFCADVLLAMSQRHRDFIERCHNADVIFEYSKRGSLTAKIVRRLQYSVALMRRRIDLLIAIEHSTRYERHLSALPATPVLIWLQDPRTEQDWGKIATVKLTDVEMAHSIGSQWVVESRRSLHNLLDGAQRLKRRIAFAHQAECLVPKARQLFGQPSLQSRFLPNPIDVPPLTQEKTTRPSVTFLGRLDPVKRPWIFLELARRFPSVEFFVMGRTHTAESMDPILHRYQDLPNLRFLGLVDGAAKLMLLQRSWALVNTSIHEALPVSFLEAFASETPVISCHNPDGLTERFGRFTGEVLGDGLDDFSLDKFAEALEQILASDKDRRRLGAEAREYVCATHTYAHFEKRLDEIFQRL